MRGLRKSECDQQEKAVGVSESISGLSNVSVSSALSTYLRSPYNCGGPTICLGLSDGLVCLTIGGVSSGVLSSTNGFGAEPDVNCPGSLPEWSATVGPLRSSDSESGVLYLPVTLKSTLLCVAISWHFGALLFEPSSKYSSIKPTQEFNFSEEEDVDEPDNFSGDSAMTMFCGGVCVIPGLGIKFPKVSSSESLPGFSSWLATFFSFQLNLECLCYQYFLVFD